MKPWTVEQQNRASDAWKIRGPVVSQVMKAALLIPCPDCGNHVGNRCFNGDQEVRPHADRTAEVRRQVLEGLAVLFLPSAQTPKAQSVEIENPQPPRKGSAQTSSIRQHPQPQRKSMPFPASDVGPQGTPVTPDPYLTPLYSLTDVTTVLLSLRDEDALKIVRSVCSDTMDHTFETRLQQLRPLLHRLLSLHLRTKTKGT